jgi:hypothetical protein
VNLPVNAPAAAAPTVNPPVNAAPPFKSSSLRLACFEPIGVSFEPIGLSLEKWLYGAITSPQTEAYAALPNLASAHEQGLSRGAHEQGLAGFEAPTWFAVFLPRGASEPNHPQARPSGVRNRGYAVRAVGMRCGSVFCTAA